jgi:MoaA/NifB/PqqE/SkfB family radical SAM enzyme
MGGSRIDRHGNSGEQSSPESVPAAYRLPLGVAKDPVCTTEPRVIFIEATNRCNLHCQTCPRTFFEIEPPQTLSFDAFARIAEQFPAMQCALLHGIGEPLFNPALARMIVYLKKRGIEVKINSNGTLLTPRRQAELVACGLDAYRCSIDAAQAATFAHIRGHDQFQRVIEGVQGLVETKRRLHSDTPAISLWCVVTKENLAELPGVVRLAARLGVPEVYLQRLVYFAGEKEEQYGLARQELAIFGQDDTEQDRIIGLSEDLAAEMGISLHASGARDPRRSLDAARPARAAPWQDCLRPWTAAYVTANGNCLPCCIAPFATQDYESLILGNLFEQPFEQLWNARPYQEFRARLMSDDPPVPCVGCGVHWSL